MRALGEIRLSRDTDESTSEERQDEQITLTAKIRGDRLVHLCRDIDVSGSISPFDREELGPWLTDPDKIAQWDVLIVAKIDRLTRSLFDFADLVRWLDKHGKYLISVTESIDMTTAHGRMIANILVAFAQFERERTGERRQEAAVKLRQSGRWNGGKPPYGYMLKEGGSGVLYQNPDTAPVVRQIVNLVIDGYSRLAVATTLNAEQVPPPRRAGIWRVPTIATILESRYLRGELQYEGSTVRDDDGNAVMITDQPLITEAEWNLLQRALKATSTPHRGQRETEHLALRIALCGHGDNPLYHQKHQGRPTAYYRCPKNCGLRMIRVDELEPAIEDFILRTYGDDVIERRVSVGKDYTAELELVGRELAELEEQYLQHALSAERFARMTTKLEERQRELTTLASHSDSEQWESTGETVAARWERSDTAGRRAMMLSLGVRFRLYDTYRIRDRSPGRLMETDWLPVEESHERLARRAT